MNYAECLDRTFGLHSSSGATSILSVLVGELTLAVWAGSGISGSMCSVPGGTLWCGDSEGASVFPGVPLTTIGDRWEASPWAGALVFSQSDIGLIKCFSTTSELAGYARTLSSWALWFRVSDRT